MNKLHMFKGNLQCIIKRTVEDIRPKDKQNSYFLGSFFNCMKGGRSSSLYLFIRRLIK
jgi:hypothetical protein